MSKNNLFFISHVFNNCLFSFLGLSQSLPVTSYIKMIDIWMLFTMTIPFLEVVLHTTNEYKNKTKSHIVPETRVDVVKVTSGEENEDTKTNNTMKLTLSMVMGNLMLPICSLIFTLIFWAVGIINSYSSGDAQGSNVSDCLTTDLA